MAAARRASRKQQTGKDIDMGKIFLIGLALGIATLIGIAAFVIQL